MFPQIRVSPQYSMRDPPADLLDALRDRYQIERELGQGGMATVYIARDLRYDRPVAFKLLRPELAAILGHDRGDGGDIQEPRPVTSITVHSLHRGCRREHMGG